MTKIIFAAVSALFFFSSCSSLKTSKTLNTANVREVSLNTTFADKVTPRMRDKIDSTIHAVALRFNREHHSFTVAIDSVNESNFIVLDFKKVHLITKQGRTTWYVIDGIGMIALPIISISAGIGFQSFNYLPKHKIRSTMTLSPALSGTGKYSKHLNKNAGVLFNNLDKQRDHLFDKFSAMLYKELADMDDELKRNAYYSYLNR